MSDRIHHTAECVVVGGGPAGLAAARTAARHGVRVTLVDENVELGGQYYRQMPAGFRLGAGSKLGRESAEGRRLIDDVRGLGIDVRLGTVAWGVFDQRTVALATEDRSWRIAAETLVLAPGAIDRPVPFPGWTLPGVFTAGGAQNLMKGYGVLPGRRVVVTGSGPLLFAVAHYLLHGGATVVAICEASPMRRMWRYGFRMVPHLDFVQQGYRYRQEIKDAGVPFLTGHVVRRALGGRGAGWRGAGSPAAQPGDLSSRGGGARGAAIPPSEPSNSEDAVVTGVVVSRCRDDWTPIDGDEQTFDVDALIVGYGFVSSLELARLAGCEQAWDAALGGWVPVRSRDMESSVPGVFVVGDGAGVAGSSVALEEGHLAGLAVAGRLGRLPGRQYSREVSRARGRLLHLAGFRRVMDQVYCFGPGIYTLAEGETTLCRCEEVTVAEALLAMREGASHANEVKAWTRVGMGRCQGRMCGPALAHLIARATGRAVSEAGIFTARPPAKPVPLVALAQEEH